MATEQHDRFLTEQKEYYEARAPEYNEWWERRGRYDLGEEENRKWAREIENVRAVFDSVPIEGDVLEPAAGTGNWTVYLAARASSVTVLDASDAMLNINRLRIREAGLERKVIYEKTDLMNYRPSRTFDAVFMAFWISHVPTDLLDGFLTTMSAATRIGGYLVILEGRKGRLRSPNPGSRRVDDETEERTLNDGRTFRIVKCADDSVDLERRLARAGFEAQIGNTDQQFLYATGRKVR